jgi:DNA modification methylase
MIVQKDSLEFLQEQKDFAFDINYSDPPYALGSEIYIRPDGKFDYKKATDFMNKWDMPTGEYWEKWFEESFRTLKHGGYCLMFGIDRQLPMFQYYAIKAGFQVRQSMYWYNISGFPKATDLSINLYKSLDIKKSLNIFTEEIFDICDQKKTDLNCLKNVYNAKTLFLKNQTEIGTFTNSKNIAQKLVQTNIEETIVRPHTNLIVQIAELKLQDTKFLALVKLNIVVENVSQNITPLRLNVPIAKNQFQNQSQGQLEKKNIVQKVVQIKVCEKITDIIKEEEALKTEIGKQKFWSKEAINALCAEVLKDLKHTISNRVVNILNLDTNYQMENVFAINVIITKSIMDNLITSTENMLESILKENLLNKKYEGYKYSIAPLKQTCETIMVFQKPYKTGSCMRDTLAYENGDETCACFAWNIDGGRVPMSENDKDMLDAKSSKNPTDNYNGKDHQKYGDFALNIATPPNEQGRYPSQTFCDSGTAERLDEQSGISKGSDAKRTRNKTSDSFGMPNDNTPEYSDTGGCSKILHKCDYENGEMDLYVYAPKVSKNERNAGCDEFPESVISGEDNSFGKMGINSPKYREGRGVTSELPKVKNNHPTLKPISLSYRVLKLFKTPNPQKIVYPFAGVQSEVIGGYKAGFTDFSGCELNAEYVDIGNVRFEHWKDKPFDEKGKVVEPKKETKAKAKKEEKPKKKPNVQLKLL